MRALVRSIPDQLEFAWQAAGLVTKGIPPKPPSVIAVCGMGGSGISGDILRGLVLHTSRVPVEVIKDYRLPAWIRDEAFAVVISYSGNTEETLGTWHELKARSVERLAITSGGKLKELALSANIPLVEVPAGYPPRASVGYLFAPLLRLAFHWGLYPEAERELVSTTSLIRSRIVEWEAQMRNLAQSLKDTFPIIHTIDVQFAPLGYRLVCQLNENAKMLAHSHIYSEMNHNEIMGFEGDVARDISLVIIDPGEEFTHPRNRMRARILSNMLPSAIPQFVLAAEGGSLLERCFSLLVKGDLLSVFLAELRGVDPFPIASIERLKQELG